MYPVIYLLAAATTAIIALVAIWAARSSLHWFWRAAALLACFLLLVPVGAAELNLLFAPMAAILFLASAGQQWWERRQQRWTMKDVGDSADRPRPKIRISLKELFLVILLAAVAAWILARIVQEGIVVDWRKLPIAVALISAVAWTAATWADKRRTWQPFWAKTAAYLIGLAMILPSINALIYTFQLETATDIVIAAASVVGLTMVITDLWLKYVGRMPQTLLLVGAIYVASYVHANYMGDWLSADYLLIEQRPTFWLMQRIVYGLLYFHVAVFVLLGILLWRGLVLPIRESWRSLILSRLSMFTLAVALVPLAWWYFQLLERPRISAAPAMSGENILAEANRLVEQIQKLRAATAPPASAAATLPLPDTPEIRRLTSDLIAVLQAASRQTTQNSRVNDPRLQEQADERLRLMGMATQLFGADEFADPASAYDHGELALAQVRYAILAQRDGLASDARMAYQVEQVGHLHLAMQQDQLRPPRMRELMRELEELDGRREPLEAMLTRDAAWSERFERWRSRLRRVVLNRETSADTHRAWDTVREYHNSCVATARMSYTNLAIRTFAAENGRLPSDLDELVPHYLSAVPIDPYSGQPLVYRLENDKYVIYTVGPDGKDDGGVNMFDGNFNDTVRVRKEWIAKVKARAAAAMAPPAKTPAAAKTAGKSPTPADP
ncbi:MAG TPA: hypothetical protein VMP01_08775 [Pirellulaceae bacterium]|nr:hypothetical protein [Pirellulaceae bacterium]